MSQIFYFTLLMWVLTWVSTGLKSRCLQDCVPLWKLQGRACSLGLLVELCCLSSQGWAPCVLQQLPTSPNPPPTSTQNPKDKGWRPTCSFQPSHCTPELSQIRWALGFLSTLSNWVWWFMARENEHKESKTRNQNNWAIKQTDRYHRIKFVKLLHEGD